MKTVIHIIDYMNKIITIIIGITAAVLFLLVFSQVVFRYVLNSSFSWTEELSRYLMIWLVFLGASLVLRKRKLISIEVLSNVLHSNAQRYLNMFVYAICIVFFCIMFVYGIDMMENVKMQVSPSLHVSMSIPYAVIPISALVLILNALAVILELILNNNTQTEKKVN